ncbi:hypothetical protein RJ640_026067 [Escallonia rubra]|uniref:DM2 domain-containing protein n=1 Tax=Escallonia rubra TaxID=112253 RepID=A0AA88RE50_9ASTE|nr:hypothetical protein RJ640_026067 [Escallonia rubra]
MSRVFNGCRVLFAAAKSSAAAPKPPSSAAADPPKKAAAAAAKPKAPATEKKAPTRTGGIQKPVPVSPALHQFLGVHEASRADAVKKIWEYVKLHNLQNPDDKRQIRCDHKLKTIFDGKETVGFLEIGKLLSRHFVKSS